MSNYAKNVGKMGALVIPKKAGIELYPLPFEPKQFFNFPKLREGFFLLEQIPEEKFNTLMELRDGITEDTPREALDRREKNMKLILGIGGLECL